MLDQRWLEMERLACGKGMVIILCLLVSGCTVPQHMLVDSGDDPQNRDEDARFRTTYYFRVFDPCSAKQGAVNTPYASDTLYRFRLTGKAHSLTTAVRFEAGTLTKQQIDPFGSTIAYDSESRNFYRRSAAENRSEAQRNQKMNELDKLLEQLAQLESLEASETGEQYALQLINHRKLIDHKITLIGELDGVTLVDETLSEAEIKALVKAEVKAAIAGPDSRNGDAADNTAAEPGCSAGRSGFKIMGPEGWRTFNQDERLVFAMSTSGEPLISTLQELSGRVLNAGRSSADTLLPTLEELMRITRSEGALGRFHPAHPEMATEVVDQVIDAFDNGSGR